MTEDEAKNKVCPKTFGIHDERDQYGGGIRQGGPHKCFASGCMAWVETSVTRVVLTNGAVVEPGQFYMRSSVAREERHVTGGYCSLFGAQP